MIFDGENMLCDKKTLSSATLYSDVLNLGPGESYQPMFLEAFLQGGTGTSPTLTATIQTAVDDEFTSPVALGEFEFDTTNGKISLPMPRGNLGYVRLKLVSTYTGGALTAGLVVDDDIMHRH
jgi:hypothetical protein